MVLRICFILLLFAVAPAFVIYINRIQFVKSRFLRTVFLLPNVILIVLAAFFGTTDEAIYKYATAITLFLIAFILICIPEFFYALMLCLTNLFAHTRRGRHRGNVIGYTLEVLSICIILYGMLTCFVPPKVRVHTFFSPDLPRTFDGYKIVHVTDLHLGTFKLFPPALNNVVKVINNQKGDLIAFTGDLVNFDSGEIAPFRDALKAMKAKDGVVSVLGNHDYLMYTRYAGDKGNQRHIDALKAEERNAGWKLLCNENIIVHRGNDSIAIAGTENDAKKKPYPMRGDLRKALSGAEGCRFKVLLTHDPSHWKDKVIPKTDIQLTLAGHTHAGQVKIFGRSVAELSYNEWNGMYYHGANRAILVSSGIGEAMLPFRLGVRPAIDVIILKCNK